MLDINNMRVKFGQALAQHNSLDKALGEVITYAYERGLDDGRRSAQAGDDFVILPHFDVEKWKRENL